MSASTDRVAMSRGLALLFGAGASLVVITLVLPHGHDEAQLGLLVPAGLAYIVVALLLTAPKAYPPVVLSATLALGTLLIGVCVLYSARAGPAYAFMYVWVALYAAAFFSLAGTLAHLAWALASYIGVLAISGDVHPPAAMWLMAAGTSAVAAALIFGLTRELRARANDLAAVTQLANELGGASEVSSETVLDAICEGVLASTAAVAVTLLEELPDGSGLHVVGQAGAPSAAAAFSSPAGIAVLDEAYRTGTAAELVEPAARRNAG